MSDTQQSVRIGDLDEAAMSRCREEHAEAPDVAETCGDDSGMTLGHEPGLLTCGLEPGHASERHAHWGSGGHACWVKRHGLASGALVRDYVVRQG
jgi:hypothetical protein